MKIASDKSLVYGDGMLAEYSAIRSEILTWIAVKYSLIAISASVTAISLSVFGSGTHWSWFSAALISIIACLGFLASHANAKITIASAYIAVFHAEKTHWEHLMYGKLKTKITLATAGYVFPSSALYFILLLYIILYPATIHHAFNFPGLREAFIVLCLPSAFYVFMIFSIWRSERRDIYESMWKNLIENNKPPE